MRLRSGGPRETAGITAPHPRQPYTLPPPALISSSRAAWPPQWDTDCPWALPQGLSRRPAYSPLRMIGRIIQGGDLNCRPL